VISEGDGGIERDYESSDFGFVHLFFSIQVEFRRSNIHGWGVFTTDRINAGEMIIEYVGEVIRDPLADRREKEYDSRGIGCYMFRLDADQIIDATKKGGLARFINHSCSPNAATRFDTFFLSLSPSLKILLFSNHLCSFSHSVLSNSPFSPLRPRVHHSSSLVQVDKQNKVVICAIRDIPPNVEVAYDYLFPIESDTDKIPCLCGSANCRGFMN
jgi:SET domain-containing protein